MRIFNITILIIALCVSTAFSQGNCVKGISTNPANPINNEFQGLINPWLNTSFEVAPIDENGFGFEPLNMNNTAGWSVPNYVSGNLLMVSPYDDGVPGRPELYEVVPFEERDFHWEDGWELLWVGLGYYPNGEPVNSTNPNRVYSTSQNVKHPSVPYIIMYNRYRGVIRIFANILSELTAYDHVNVYLEFNNTSGLTSPVSGLLRHVRSYDQALDKNTVGVSAVSNHANAGNQTNWFSTDIQIGFDPCTCYFGSKLRLRFEGVDVSDLVLKGRSVTIEDELFDENGDPKDYAQIDFLNVRDFNSEPAGNIIYKRIEGMIDDCDYCTSSPIQLFLPLTHLDCNTHRV
ncbi:hypothetical protein HZR84_03815 [Hyphobacterium sp. CCMP332]|nr:hypothetical protein HZR84_03815 [Hyphobacterium sp. CCMP332]